MEEIIRAAILGLVQGLTEFLPVSSSGHLELAKYLLRDDSLAAESLLMTIVLHGATALATIFVFRREVGEILRGSIKLRSNRESRYVLKIILSMIPAVLVGLLLESEVEMLFSRRILLVGFMLIITGLLLFLADRARRTEKKVGYQDALVIGLAQAIAILPGISRSGATISTSVLLGIDRERSARFSFLMVVPLIFGKIAKELIDGDISQSGGELLPLLVGFTMAFFSGWLACSWMVRLVRQSKLTYFSLYCFGVAAFAIGSYYWT